MISATLPKRGTDSWGSGEFGASRGSRTHKGIDYACPAGAVIHSPVTGLVTKLGYPYADNLEYRYIEITTVDQLRHRIFYVEPISSKGDVISTGQVIGVCQDIAWKYYEPDVGPMKNHIHYEILEADGTPINPESL